MLSFELNDLDTPPAAAAAIMRVYGFCAFISHAGTDRDAIRAVLHAALHDPLADRSLLGCGESLFFYSKNFGGGYKDHVSLAMRSCGYAVVFAGRNSRNHEFIESEINFLIRKGKNIAVYMLQDVDLEEVHPDLEAYVFAQEKAARPSALLQRGLFDDPVDLRRWIMRVDPDSEKRADNDYYASRDYTLEWLKTLDYEDWKFYTDHIGPV